MSTRIPEVGETISFADQSATVTTDDLVVAEGTVNGPPIFIEGGFMVPAWCERDNGREATTVYVHSSNLLARKASA